MRASGLGLVMRLDDRKNIQSSLSEETKKDLKHTNRITQTHTYTRIHTNDVI